VEVQRIKVDIERLSDSKQISNESVSEENEEDADDEEPSEISAIPSRYDQQRLNEISPKINVIMAGNLPQNKLFDKYEVTSFERLFRILKYKYEDIIKVLKIYSEVCFISN